MSDSQKEFYSLTYEAKSDVDDIFDYSESKFGYNQALEYFLDLESLFEQLVNFPHEGIIRNDIQENIRSIPVGSHIVYYSVLEKSILIIRILHHSQNAQEYFK